MRLIITIFVALVAVLHVQAYPLDTPPRAIFLTAPEYSAASKSKQSRGIVYFRVLITAKGTTEVRKIFPASSEEFVDIVRDAVTRWNFEPATHEYRPTAVTAEFAVLFDPAEGATVKGPFEILFEKPNQSAQPTPGS